MTKDQLNELRKLSREEKIELVQTLRDDIATDQSANDIPEEHKELLEKTLQRLAEGSTQFNNWEEVREKYGRKK